MKLKPLFTNLFFTVLLSFSLFAQDGILDTSFGSSGLVQLASGTFDDKIHDMVVQPDGKIVLAGYSYTETYNFIVVRLNTNGSLDDTFGNNGVVVLPFGSINPGSLSGDKAYSVDLAPDGKIVIAGETTGEGSKSNVGIVKLLSNGTLDSTFGDNGMISIPIPSANAYTRSCVVDDKSNIYVTGGAYSSNQFDVFVIKCDRYGQLDASFGESGIVVYPVYPFQNDLANKILLDKNGKIMIAGTAYNKTNEDYLVMRFNKNGTLDTTFSENGFEVFGFFGSFNEQCYGMIIQPDEKIVLAGHSNNSYYDVILTRLESNGNLDLGFGSSGIVYTDHGTSVDVAQATDLVLQPDGKIIVGGLAVLSQRTHYNMTRYNPEGAIDTSFGNNGFVYTNFTQNSDDQALAMALQEDGKILLAGQTYDGQGFISAARYNNPSVLALLSLNEVTQSAINFWPNPTEGKMHLEGINSNQINVAVYDVSGRVVLSLNSQKENDNHTLNLSTLNEGLYFVKIESNEQDDSKIRSIPIVISPKN